MAKPEWGKKHTCTSCGIPFYDLKRKTIVCPSCGEELKQSNPKPRASAPVPKPVPKEAAKPAPAADEEDLADDDIEIDDDLANDEIDADDDDDDDDDLLEGDSALIGEDEDENVQALDDSETK